MLNTHMIKFLPLILALLCLSGCDPRNFGELKLLNIELQDLRSSTKVFCDRENRPPKADEIHFGHSSPLQNNYWLISAYEKVGLGPYVVMIVDRLTQETEVIYRGDSRNAKP
jgi:hypothetical protein